MPRVAIRPSRDLASLFRQRRKDLNLTLREAEEKSRGYGKVIPFSTLGKVEQGRVDPGVIRFQQLLDIYDIPRGMALDVVALETLRGEMPKKADPHELYEEGVRQWKSGNASRAVAALYALREAAGSDPRFVEIRQRGQLQLAIVAGGLGRLQMSKHVIEELLKEPLPNPLVLRSLIQLAVCWERLGVHELALAVLARAETHAANTSPQELAWFAQERGLIELSLGQHAQAQQHLEQARKLYKGAGDEEGVAKTSFSLVRVLLAAGQASSAIRAAQQLVETVSEPGFERFKAEATVLLGHAHLASRQIDKALVTLRTALAEAVSSDSVSARFLAHHYLAHAYNEAGDAERGRAEESAAQQFRKYIDFNPDPVVFEGGRDHGTPARSEVGVRKRRQRQGQ